MQRHHQAVLQGCRLTSATPLACFFFAGWTPLLVLPAAGPALCCFWGTPPGAEALLRLEVCMTASKHDSLCCSCPHSMWARLVSRAQHSTRVDCTPWWQACWQRPGWPSSQHLLQPWPLLRRSSSQQVSAWAAGSRAPSEAAAFREKRVHGADAGAGLPWVLPGRCAA